MPWGAAAVAGAAIVGSVISADANKSAANTQAEAARQNQEGLLAAGRSAATEFQPYKELGTLGIENQRANNAYFNKQFSNQDLNANLAPNYDWGLKTGQQTNLMANNATGGAVGGNALSALNTYSQNYAQNAYQNAFNNFQTQRGNIAAQNNNLTNFGLAGATGTANATIGTATNVAGLGMSAANANAASQIAQGNIYAGGVNSLGSLGYGYSQGMFGNKGGGGGGYSGGYGSGTEGSSNFIGPTQGNDLSSFGLQYG
jgi:hypothetical protein